MGWDGVKYVIKIDGRADGDLFIAIMNFPTQIMCLIYLIFDIVSMKGLSPVALGRLEWCWE